MDEAAEALERVVDDARQRGDVARREGATYVAAWHAARAGQALLQLGRPAESLPEFDQAVTMLSAVRAEGVHELREMLFVTAQYVNAGEPLPSLPDLEAWVAIGRASALTALGRWSEAAAAVEAARPLVKGWSRGQLRKVLNAISDQIARNSGASEEALGALNRQIAARDTDAAARLQARYERAALLREQGRPQEAMRESLLLIRDADAAGDAWILAAARQVLGALLIDMGSVADGVQTLVLAFDGFADAGDPQAMVGAAPGLAWQLSENADSAGAARVLRRAIAAADDILARGDAAVAVQIRVARVDLLIALGTTCDRLGLPAEAVDAFESAVVGAEQLDDLVRAADARHGEAITRISDASDPGAAVDALAELDAARAAYEAAGLSERAAGCMHESAALLARLGSFDAAVTRYTAARDAYLAMPEVLRDTGSWPDELADCEANLAILAGLGADRAGDVPQGAFTSGGHRMRHPRTGT